MKFPAWSRTVAVMSEPPLPARLAAMLAGAGAASVIAGAATVRFTAVDVTLDARAVMEAVPARRPFTTTVAWPFAFVVKVGVTALATELGLTVNTTVVPAATVFPLASRTVAVTEAPVDPAVTEAGKG
jgi:hypothetical protein